MTITRMEKSMGMLRALSQSLRSELGQRDWAVVRAETQRDPQLVVLRHERTQRAAVRWARGVAPAVAIMPVEDLPRDLFEQRPAFADDTPPG
ncbi:hypothetical protein ACIOG4_28045 [Streptomyces microflavus]|uniref:hypothetical protein n=1 Tax=Streptomyces microflavus TaxID=1919 RepID=UPI0038264573